VIFAKIYPRLTLHSSTWKPPYVKLVRRLKKTGPNIRAHPDCVHAIADAGFDVVGLANNHIMDYGAEGLQETVSACANAGLTVCGAGRNLQEAQQVLFVEKKGVTIAIIAVAEHEFSIAEPDRPGAAPLDPIDNTMQIEYARSKADLVFVTIHGGNEYFPYPRPGLRKICRYFIDRGADGVMCHHVHVPGAYELYKQKLIVYSLGNLLFDHANPPQGWNEGYAARLVFDTATKTMLSHELIPYRQSVADGGIAKLQGVEKQAFTSMLKGYRDIISNEEQWAKVWKDFCARRSRSVILRMFFPIHLRGLDTLARIIPIEKMCSQNHSYMLEKTTLGANPIKKCFQPLWRKNANSYPPPSWKL